MWYDVDIMITWDLFDLSWNKRVYLDGSIFTMCKFEKIVPYPLSYMGFCSRSVDQIVFTCNYYYRLGLPLLPMCWICATMHSKE